MKRFITPRLLWAALLTAAVGGVVYGILGSVAPHSRTTAWFRLLTHPLNFAAYGLAFYLCRLISADYRSPSTMRLAWNLMAASSLTAIVRYAYEFFVGLVGSSGGSPFLSLIAHSISTNLAILLLLGSLALMWSSFAQFGMGFKLRRGQIVLILAILLMVPPLLWRTELYRAGPGLDAVIRELSRMMTPVLLAMVGALGVLLFSVSEEMGRGHLSKSLHYLVAFVAIRLGSLLGGAYQEVVDATPVSAIRVGVWWALPWVFALAMVYRWQLTVEMSRVIGQLESEPDMVLRS